jgi:hypothetical protein
MHQIRKTKLWGLLFSVKKIYIWISSHDDDDDGDDDDDDDEDVPVPLSGRGSLLFIG